jgi:hypothetical protein
VLKFQHNALCSASSSQLIQSAKENTVLFFLDAEYRSSQTAVTGSLLG